MTGRRITLPKGFKLDKQGKVAKTVFHSGTASGIIQRKKAKQGRVVRKGALR